MFYSSTKCIRCICFIASLILSAEICSSDKAQCVMYGQCGEGEFGTLNCLYSGPPKLVDDKEALEILKELCPEYAKESSALTCCDSNQIAQLDANFKLPERLLGRCPACFANFRKNFCKLTCSPTQSDHLMVTKTERNSDGKEMVKELVYFINKKFVNGLFQSCKAVEGIIPGTRVIDMMCGKQGSKCTGPDWLAFMGSTPDNGGFSPVQLNYTILESAEVEIEGQKFYPMNEKTYRCSESITSGGETCACSDCNDACKATESAITFSEKSNKNNIKSSNITSSQKSSSLSSAGEALPNNNNEGSLSTEKYFSKNDAFTEEEQKNHSSRSKLSGNKLFQRILSPLIIIAPALGDN